MPKCFPYNLLNSSIGNIHNSLNGIPYVAIYTILKNSTVDFSYFMLLGRPWLKDAKVKHDWGNNVIVVQGNGIIKTISINRKLGAKTKYLFVTTCWKGYYMKRKI